ncbi:MAG: hypothetical protein VBE63_16520 [Lamprobacter sp.]|uniref:hypothetical protein n=1 Tax=Lamprobacter sp. TaxID=3100796 RepID=UPI002B2624D7|nr:hypothetical protein [Lamprobacter sp.]MEA3641527.1 hypothetical protein [Lamprobacter sp.]
MRRHPCDRWLLVLLMPLVTLLISCAADHRERSSMTLSQCIEPAHAKSPDIRRNLSDIERAGLCYRHQQVREGRFTWSFHILEHRQHPQGPFWILPHDNENTAFDVGVQAVIDYGGGLLAVDSGGQRHFLGQDPNRNFSRTNAEAKRCPGQRHPAPGYSQAVLDHYRSRRGPILALHNNLNGWTGNGGAGSISLERESPSLRAYPGQGSGRLRDEDNLVFVAGTRPLQSDPALKHRIKALNEAGLNVMHKQVSQANFDCSLSDYVSQHRLGEYYNIEAEHGDRHSQQQMVERLLAVLGIPRLSAERPSSPFLQP